MVTMDDVKRAHESGRLAATKYERIREAVYAEYNDSMSSVEGIAWTMGFEGRELREVTGWRYGNIPECGRSVNYRDNEYEVGVSLMALDGEDRQTVQMIAEGMSASDRPVVRVRGYLSGYGACGEPLVIGAEEIR